MSSLKIKVELSGGLELLFGKIKKHEVTITEPTDTKEPMTIKSLLKYIEKNMVKERPELFIQKDTVRPGILVLINDTDWELEGGLDYKVKDGDTIVFISTLHGG